MSPLADLGGCGEESVPQLCERPRRAIVRTDNRHRSLRSEQSRTHTANGQVKLFFPRRSNYAGKDRGPRRGGERGSEREGLAGSPHGRLAGRLTESDEELMDRKGRLPGDAGYSGPSASGSGRGGGGGGHGRDTDRDRDRRTEDYGDEGRSMREFPCRAFFPSFVFFFVILFCVSCPLHQFFFPGRKTVCRLEAVS